VNKSIKPVEIIATALKFVAKNANSCRSEDVKDCVYYSETASKTGMIMVFGEISSTAAVDYQQVVRETINNIGYDDSTKGSSF